MSVIIVAGPTCAGKSTFIKQNFPDRTVIDIYDFQQNCLINPDTILESYEACKVALQDALRSGKKVVLEHTLLCQKRRPMYIDAIREITDEDIEMFFIIPTISEHMRRARQRNIKLTVDYVRYMHEIAEVPTIIEGYSNVHIIRDTAATI